MLPILWALMSSKSTEAYEVVIEFIRLELLPFFFPKTIMTDFEGPLRNVIKKYFDAHIAGCLVHHERVNIRYYKEKYSVTVQDCFFIQAILRKLKELQLDEYVKENDSAAEVCSRLISLAFLPEELIEQQFFNLKINMPLNISATLMPLFDYYENYWI